MIFFLQDLFILDLSLFDYMFPCVIALSLHCRSFAMDFFHSGVVLL